MPAKRYTGLKLKVIISTPIGLIVTEGVHGVVISSNSTVKIKVWSGPMLGGAFEP